MCFGKELLTETQENTHTFFIRTSKVLMRLNVFVFLRFAASKCSFLFLFCMKHFYLLTAKITPDANNWGYFIKGYEHFIDS